ncbi:hypothetical protein JHK87_009925 [Glycine soja]|nr:hypothetical protein JHK87_009925 [Glycine soja]
MIGNDRNTEIEQVQKDLRNKIQWRKYLHGLDDVWNEDRELWLKLKTLVIEGGKGSIINVTTRSRTVAKIMGTRPPLFLEGLDLERSWRLFSRVAFYRGFEFDKKTLIQLWVAEGFIQPSNGIRSEDVGHSTSKRENIGNRTRYLSSHTSLHFDEASSSAHKLRTATLWKKKFGPVTFSFSFKPEVLTGVKTLWVGYCNNSKECRRVEAFELTCRLTLTHFLLDCKSSSGSMSELSGLNSLRGKLEIKWLDSLRDNAKEVESAKVLLEKQHLQELELRWCHDEEVRESPLCWEADNDSPFVWEEGGESPLLRENRIADRQKVEQTRKQQQVER